MIDEAAGVDKPCAVCAMDVADCVCPECPVCGEQGNPSCYAIRGRKKADKRHGLKLNKDQSLARQRAVIFAAKQRLSEEERNLTVIESNPMEWYLHDLADPWG
jgi:hypothetical protein